MKTWEQSPRFTGALGPLLAGAVGAGFFAWIAGARVLSPVSIDWVLQLDWQHHFMGWHFFRGEPWHFPPGRIANYYAPMGTSIGFTDSIPLASLLLKPFASALPMPFQFLGLWLGLCFTLQGVWGALITSVWTRSVVLQLAGGVLFVLVPTLLGRVGHPALASHWLLLWALWLYLRDVSHRVATWQFAVLALACGLIHPYLAAMVMLIIVAICVRRVTDQRDVPGLRGIGSATLPLLVSASTLLLAWWSAGLFSVSGTSDLVSTGLDQYSMNVLGPIAAAGWSRFLPNLPVASDLQNFEGFQYLGLGNLALLACAVALAGRSTRSLPWRATWPLIITVTLSAIYALSPRVTFGANTVIDVLTPQMERFAMFRATGRFFWPATYALLALAIAVIVRRLPARVAAAILCAAIALQIADVSGHYEAVRNMARSDAFFAWPRTLHSPLWRQLVPRYKHMLLYPPEHCSVAPVAFLHPALLAGEYGLSINAGHVARFDRAARFAYCDTLDREFDAGVVVEDSVYLLNPGLLEQFKVNAQRPVVCAPIDGIPVCVTASSYEAWKHLAIFR